MTPELGGPTLLLMNDLTLVIAALFGLALTAGAIVRDTRHRVAAALLTLSPRREAVVVAIHDSRPVTRVA